MSKIMIRILSRFLMQRGFVQLAATQRAAIIQTLTLTVVPPGRTPDSERIDVRAALLEMPWAAGARLSSPRLACAEDPDFLTLVAGSLARELADFGVREHVYRMMVGLLFVDGGTERELSLLDPIRIGLGLGPVRAGELVEALKDDLVAMVV
jgi:hypothetical protein